MEGDVYRVLGSLLLIGSWLSGCGGSEDDIPAGANTIPGTDETSTSSGCAYTEWSWEGSSLVDPLTCLAWSDRSATMTWYEAVSADEAVAGGCTANCDIEGEGDYCADLDAGDGFSDWKLPSEELLSELALRAAPFDDLSGDLWTRDSDSTFDQLAWTVELDQAGQQITLDKNSGAYVRCVTTAQ
jgi:hypothetical protein